MSDTEDQVDRDAARRRLSADRRALEEQIAALESQFDGFVEAADLVAIDDEHDPEGHTIAYERQQVAALLRDARSQRDALDAALRRVELGTYGRCTRCGQRIAAERLEALPGAEHCIDCAA